jgi:hypothetical protein
MSGDLSRIDWHNHDGVNLSMINDFVRNRFYNNIIKSSVNNRDVLDIGFGTGLLSILALDHGARHVTAYESDADRFLLGQNIIRDLKLEKKINLINDRFNHSLFKNYKNHVTITETVNGNLWQEGLINSLPRKKQALFVPNNYFLNIYAVEVSSSFAQYLTRLNFPSVQFAPGIDIDPRFVNTVNFYCGGHKEPDSPQTTTQTLQTIDTQNNTVWGHIPYMRCISTDNIVAGYSVNVKNLKLLSFKGGTSTATTFDVDSSDITLDFEVNVPGYLLLVPRVGMQHNEHTLFLDQGHWGPTLSPVIVNNYTGNIKVTHNLHTGDLTYELAH